MNVMTVRGEDILAIGVVCARVAAWGREAHRRAILVAPAGDPAWTPLSIRTSGAAVGGVGLR